MLPLHFTTRRLDTLLHTLVALSFGVTLEILLMATETLWPLSNNNEWNAGIVVWQHEDSSTRVDPFNNFSAPFCGGGSGINSHAITIDRWQGDVGDDDVGRTNKRLVTIHLMMFVDIKRSRYHVRPYSFFSSSSFCLFNVKQSRSRLWFTSERFLLLRHNNCYFHALLPHTGGTMVGIEKNGSSNC